MTRAVDPRVVRALGALRVFVNAGVELERVWKPVAPFDPLTENLPPDFVEFTEQLQGWILWRDRVARAVGEPEGDGTPLDVVPPRPPEILADEPEDPALDVEASDGVTPRERYEARVRLEQALHGGEALPLGWREGHGGEVACPHRDTSVCPVCAARAEVVDVYGQFFWVRRAEDRAALRGQMAEGRS